MVKKIEYIQCDCEKCNLEGIARTQYSVVYDDPDQHKDVAPIYQTTFFNCTNCDLIYRGDTVFPGGSDGSISSPTCTIEMIDPYGMRIKPYFAELTKQEIKRYSPNIYGLLDQNEGNKIISERN
jgi:hypothetical protein